jgi:hypothetical protein
MGDTDGALRTFFDRISRGSVAPALRARPWLYGISDGTLSGKTPLYLYGYRGGLTSGDACVLAAGITPTTHAYPYPTADQTLKLKSSSINDDGAPPGTGAQTVRVWWLNAAGVESTVDVVMNGTTIVATAVVTMRRVNRMEVLTCGADGSNAGDINAYPTDGVTILMRIPLYVAGLGGGVSAAAMRTVPAGKRDVIVRYNTPGYTTTNVTRKWLRYRTAPDQPWLIVSHLMEIVSPSSPPGAYFETPIRFEAGTDWQVVFNGGAVRTECALVGWTEDA